MHITIKNNIVNHLDEKNHRDDKSVDDHIPNGHSSSSSSGDQNDESVDSQGGRLKFFKDGKMILELTQAKLGEKVLWIKASNGTFWPPHSLITATSRLENCATSDDNSSLQSSPWQRDHSWKQVRPTKLQFRHFEKNFMFRASNNKKSHQWLLKISTRKLGKNPTQEIALKSKECQLCSLNVNECDIIECNNEKRSKRKQPGMARAHNVLDKVIKNITKRFQKHVIVHKSMCSGGELLSPTASPSPRKRILRDLDKVSLTNDTGGAHQNQSFSAKSENCSDSNSNSKSSVSVVVAVATASAALTTTTLSMTSSAMSATGSDCDAAATAAAAAAMAAYANGTQSSQKKRARCSNTRLPSNSNKTEEKTLSKNTNYSISSLLGKKDSIDSLPLPPPPLPLSPSQPLHPPSLSLSSLSPSSTSTHSRDQPLLKNISSSATAALSPLMPIHSEYPLLQTCLLSSPPMAHQYSNQQTYFGSCNRSTDHYFFVQNNLKKSVDYAALHSSPSSAFSAPSGQKSSNSTSSNTSDVPLNLSKNGNFK